jgi:TM2 domain-containing membrane protein YozV
MRPAVKAFLLSALVFPGLGQLYKQQRRKGIILILLGNLLLALVLLTGVMTLSQEYMTSVYPEAITVAKLRVLLTGVLSRPLFYIPVGIFLALWGFAAADAALSAVAPAEEEL